MKRVSTDGLEVTRDEALELCVHHLKLACLLFEAIPDDAEDGREFGRLIAQGGRPIEPCVTWFEEMVEHYQKLKKDQEDERG